MILLAYMHKHIPDPEQRQETLQQWRLIPMAFLGGFRGSPMEDSISHLGFASY